MLDTYRLQLLSHGEIFETRERAEQYLADSFRVQSKWAEPAVVFYGTEADPKMILAVGASHGIYKKICTIDIDGEVTRLEEIINNNNSEIEDALTGINQSIDDINDAIDDINGVNNEQSDLIAQLRADLISTYEAAGLTYDENKINDRITYEPDSNDTIIRDAATIAEAVQKLSEFAQALQVELENSALLVEDTNSVSLSYDNGTLTANVLIAANGENSNQQFDNNIIDALDNRYGGGLYAAVNLEYDAQAHNLIFTTSGLDTNGVFKSDAKRTVINLGTYRANNNNHNVAVSINAETFEISADVPSITASVNNQSNELTIAIGNTSTTVALPPSVKLIHHIEYDPQNRNILIYYTQNDYVTVGISELFESWQTQNNADSAITLTKADAPDESGVVYLLSADVKLKSGDDNLLKKANDANDGSLYVSKSEIATSVDEQIATAIADKVDTATMNAALATKANVSDVTAAIASVNDALDLKADKDYADEKFATKTELNSGLNTKQDVLTFDSTPANNSMNPVTSGGIKLYVDEALEGVDNALEGKQDVLTFDITPTLNSTNPVTSGGIAEYVTNAISGMADESDITDIMEALNDKANINDVYTKQVCDATFATKDNTYTKDEINASCIENVYVEQVNRLKYNIQYSRVGSEGKIDAGSIEIPENEDKFLKSVEVIGTKVRFIFTTETGEKQVDVDLSGYIDTYTAGSGINIDTNNGNKISVKLAQNETRLNLTDGVLQLNLSDIEALIDQKADQSYVDEELETKANVADVESAMGNVESEIQNLETNKQDKLTFDSTPTESSNNPVTSGGVKTYVDNAVSTINTSLDGKQDVLTFDSVPTDNSLNPVTSDGLYDAFERKADKSYVDSTFATKSEVSENVSLSDMNTALAAKADKTYVDETFATKTEVSAKANTTDVNHALAAKADANSVYTKTESDQTFATKSEVTVALADIANVSDVYTKNAADGKFVSKSDMNTALSEKQDKITAVSTQTVTLNLSNNNELTADVDMPTYTLSYEGVTNVLTLKEGSDTVSTIQLVGVSVINGITYDRDNKKLIINYTLADQQQDSNVEIDMADLVDTYVLSVDNEYTPVLLNVTDTQEGQKIKAELSIADDSSNRLEERIDTVNRTKMLYVSNNANDYVATINGVTKTVTAWLGDIADLQAEVDRLTSLIETMSQIIGTVEGGETIVTLINNLTTRIEALEAFRNEGLLDFNDVQGDNDPSNDGF